MQVARRTAMRFLQVWAGLLVTVLLPQTSFACLGCYYSPDWLVVHSPLILIGRIENVEKVDPKQVPSSGYRPLSDRLDPDRPGPTMAQVRVLRVLRGKYSNPIVTVYSGPIETCSPSAVHYSFKAGEELLFLLPTIPSKHGAALRYQLSLLPVSKTHMIESRLTRARQYQADYLAEMERERPQTYLTARKLVEQMRQVSPKWPELTRVPVNHMPGHFTDEEGEAFKSAKETLVKDLAGIEVEAIRTADAIDWLSDDSTCWSRHPLWGRALWDLAQARGKEAATAERARIRRELVRNGVEQGQIDRYLADIPDSDLAFSLGFPPHAPYSHRKHSPENLTTDFILRFHSYDRGAMFRDYGMRFEVLAELDAPRVSMIIPALYGSDDQQLRVVACRAIERIVAKVSPVALLRGIGMMVVALGFVAYAAVRRLGWGYLGLGALFWVVTVAFRLAWAIAVHPSVYRLTQDLPETSANSVFALYIGALIAVFEVGITWLVLRYTRLGRAGWSRVLAFGIGFGAIEAVLRGIASRSIVLSEMLSPAPFPVAMLDQIACANNVLLGLTPIFERFFTVLIHVFASALIFYSIVRRRPGWFWMAFFYKTLIDAVAACGPDCGIDGLGQIWTLKAITAVWGVVGLLGTGWVGRHYPADPLADTRGEMLPSPVTTD